MTKTKDTTTLSVTLVIIKFARANGSQSERAEAFASREHAIRMLPEYVQVALATWAETSSTIHTLRVIRDAKLGPDKDTVTILTVTHEGALGQGVLVRAFESQAQALAALPLALVDETRPVTIGLRTLKVIPAPTVQP